MLQFASHSFDVSIDDILLTFLSGACLCIPSEEARFDGISDFIGQANANYTHITPSVAATLDAPAISRHIRKLLLGGERLTRPLIDQWAPYVDLINVYEPTEACVNCLVTGVIDEHVSNASNIGRGLGVIPWLVNIHDHTKLAPIGAIGELCIQGPSLASGYLDDPVNTAAAFVNSPDWTQRLCSHRKMYKTGDLCVFSDNGEITYVGRKIPK